MNIDDLLNGVKAASDKPLVELELIDTGNKIEIDGKKVRDLRWEIKKGKL